MQQLPERSRVIDTIRIEERADTGAATVVGLLEHRPATWLRSFLQLSLLPGAATRGGNGSTAVPWYRLGPTAEAGPEISVPFIWWPHSDDGVFSRFHGRFVIRQLDDSCMLALDGSTTGGTPERNRSTLYVLLTLMSKAVSSSDQDDG
ncbi:MAG: hypothetical protein ABSF84_07090 [Acidimicrobiales bacterium]